MDFGVILLAIIQGISEFLPISSSAHLIIFRDLFGIGSSITSEMALNFDIALHFGTLLAIGIYFFKDFMKLIKDGLTKGPKDKTGKIFWYLVIATIPAGILSLVLDKVSSSIVGDNIVLEMSLIAVALIVMGIILYIVDKKCKSETNYENISLKQSILVGISQAIAAAFPGVSRSGITMTVSRALKIDRQSAAKFSFLLATPITFAAAIVNIKDFVFNTPFVVGVLASFILGLIVIKFFLKYLKKGSFKGFAIYRVVLGIIIFTLLIFNH